MCRFLLSNTLNTRDLGGYPIDCRKITSYKVKQKYNSVEEYLSQIGLNDNEILKIKTKLITCAE